MFSLNPEISRAPFTVEEDCILMAAIKEYSYNFREFPTNLLPGRNMRQIRSRYNNVLKFVNTREHWTEEHDLRLMELVEKHGTSEWAKISESMVTHTRTSCRQRYTTIKKFLDKYPEKTVSDVPKRKRAFSTNVTTDNWMDAIIEAKDLESIQSARDDERQIMITQTKSSKKVMVKPVVQLHNTPYFDYLKYSFNFKFGESSPANDALFENIQIACQLLQAPNLPKQVDLYNESFSCFVLPNENCRKVELEPDLLKSLIELGKNDFQFPVNLNTVLAFRGLTAMFNYKLNRKTFSKKKESSTLIKVEPNSFENYRELNLFKLRFKSIFKHTATLTKMHRKSTIVSLRLRNQDRKENTDETITTTDFHNNETLLRIADESTSNIEYCDISTECREMINENRRITVLESTTIGLGTPHDVDPLQLLQPSTSYQTYKYHVEPSDSVKEIKIQPFIKDNEEGGLVCDDPSYSTTEFVIWTPTITDEATGSTKSPNKINKHE